MRHVLHKGAGMLTEMGHRLGENWQWESGFLWATAISSFPSCGIPTVAKALGLFWGHSKGKDGAVVCSVNEVSRAQPSPFHPGKPTPPSSVSADIAF